MVAKQRSLVVLGFRVVATVLQGAVPGHSGPQCGGLGSWEMVPGCPQFQSGGCIPVDIGPWLPGTSVWRLQLCEQGPWLLGCVVWWLLSLPVAASGPT